MIKKALKFALFCIPIAAVAGIFIGFFQLETASKDIIAKALMQCKGERNFLILAVLQTVLYAFFSGFLGYILSNKVQLWRPIKFTKEKVLKTIVISIVCGVSWWGIDNLLFVKMIEELFQNNYNFGISAWLGGILYGGVVEELMNRLFFMSFIIFIIKKLFYKSSQSDQIPEKVFHIANIINALFFALGHIPATAVYFGNLSSMILFRCFIGNMGFGLVFGELYRRYGIIYSMISHATIHVVINLITLLFL